MAQLLPITLSGENLGQRHRSLNSQVNQAVTEVSFQDIENQPEKTPADRLFKIDVANKLKNVEYILANLKDDDMLYVSRALKSKWLLEHRDIINPKYLEEVLYPVMVMPAISKMKHWLYINLHNPITCQEFYEFYKESEFSYAVKFLNQCNIEFLLNEFPKILIKISPYYLKVLGQKCPKLVKIYYESIATDNDLIRRYLRQEQMYYNNIKCMLKLDPDMFLDITEKYHSLTTYNKLSPSATAFILRFYKNRFMAKSELYVAHLLDIPTVARCLSDEECKDIVIKLARADYLSWWFSYDNIEPLVKRINRQERAAFKKKVFVEKDVGEHVAQYPYALPASPAPSDINTDEAHVFNDRDFNPIVMLRPIMKKKGRHGERVQIVSCLDDYCQEKSELQKLFDEFRFVGFEGALYELRGRVRSMSSADRRRDILMVLVSKTGGRADAVGAMLEVALSLRNEPVHVRAAIVRSLVKRACAWRLPQQVWDTMLEYGHGLGLDGSEPEAECLEGLHAVVIRQLITTGDCDTATRTAFFNNFSTLAEYKLVATEREKVCTGLQTILVAGASSAVPEIAANYLNQLLDVLEKYHIPFDSSVVSAIAALAERDWTAAKSLLERLYDARVGRRELFRQNLKFRHNDAALLNALRHEPEAVTPEFLIELLIKGETRANRSLLKLMVYFTEKEGLVEQIRRALIEKIANKPHVKLARPLAMFAGSDLSSIWHELEGTAGEQQKIAKALRANMHHARPAPDALTLGWHKGGMKLIAWQAMRCRPAQITKLVKSLLEQKGKRTVRLALALAQRTDCAADIFATAITKRPLAALRAAVFYFRHLGTDADLNIWEIVKPLMQNVDLTCRKGLCQILDHVEWIPKTIKADYCAILYLALEKIWHRNKDYVLNDVIKFMSDISEDLLQSVLLRILLHMNRENPISFPAIFIRFLLLSKNEDELKARYNNVGELFFNKLDDFHEGRAPCRTHYFPKLFEQLVSSLLFNLAFFDSKYECCSLVIEKVLTWTQKFLPREAHFGEYVKQHTTMLYYKAVRQSMKQEPEVFIDPVRKMREGVDIVGFLFGRDIAKEASELMSNYFDSVIEIYSRALVEYFNNFFMDCTCRRNFTAAVAKGILSESVGREIQLAVHVLKCHNLDGPAGDEIKDLIIKSEDKETQYILYAEIFA